MFWASAGVVNSYIKQVLQGHSNCIATSNSQKSALLLSPVSLSTKSKFLILPVIKRTFPPILANFTSICCRPQVFHRSWPDKSKSEFFMFYLKTLHSQNCNALQLGGGTSQLTSLLLLCFQTHSSPAPTCPISTSPFTSLLLQLIFPPLPSSDLPLLTTCFCITLILN